MTTWSQKRKTVSYYIEDNYGKLFRRKGFSNYGDEALSWYKVKNGLLYTIHIMSEWASPFWFNITYSVHPLFSWEHIAYTFPRKNWPDYFEQPEHGIDPNGLEGLTIAEIVLGELPRPFYEYQRNNIVHYLGDSLICHWNTERNGVELFEEIVFPVFQKIDSVEKVYDLHKTYRAMKIITNDNSNDHPVLFFTEEEYRMGKYPREISVAFADECLYFNDTEWFPFVRNYLQNRVPNINTIYQSFPPYKTMKGKEEVTATYEHAQKLVKYIDTGDRRLLEKILADNKERMISQIKEKIPELMIDSIELHHDPSAIPLQRKPFQLR